jgi:hypothetical protein
MRCFAALEPTRCARLVALWLHCIATGCASLQHGIRRCTMPHRRTAHSRGTPYAMGGRKGIVKGYASPIGHGTSLAVVGRADHVGLVRRTRRLGLRTAGPRAPSASRRRAGGASACRRALHGLHGLAERTRAEGGARAQRGGRVRVGWGGGRAEADRLTAVSAARGLGCGRERGVQHALHVRIAEHAAPAQHSRRQPA